MTSCFKTFTLLMMWPHPERSTVYRGNACFIRNDVSTLRYCCCCNAKEPSRNVPYLIEASKSYKYTSVIRHYIHQESLAGRPSQLFVFKNRGSFPWKVQCMVQQERFRLTEIISLHRVAHREHDNRRRNQRITYRGDQKTPPSARTPLWPPLP